MTPRDRQPSDQPAPEKGRSISSRDRADRIARRDYFRRRTPIEKWKLRLCVAALAAAAAFAAPGLLLDSFQFQYSHGPVCQVHAAWENDCEACHVPFEPINENTWLQDIFGGSSEGERWKNLRCQGCHAGPVHHEVRVDSQQTCGSCHRDHQGRQASLVDLPSSDCTRCHADLADHMPDGATPAFHDVTGFADAEDHPEFGPLARFDAKNRTLKFSHAVHMTPGQKLFGDQTAGLKRLSEISDPVARERYRKGGQGDDSVVTLDCQSCHTLSPALDPTDDPLTIPVGIPRSQGRYFLPIDYEAHCQACHPTDGFDIQDNSWSVPHGVQPGKIRPMVSDRYAARQIDEKDWLLPFEMRPPSERLDHPPSGDKKLTLRSQVDEQLAAAGNMLLSERGCVKCHDHSFESGQTDPWTMAITPTRIPTVYYKHAKFDHAAHRAVDCQSCHPGAYTPLREDGTQRLIEKADLDLPNLANCMKCHSPPHTGDNGTSLGGVAHNCTECHTYHDGVHGLAGPGAAAWDPTDKMDIEAFLNSGK